jgi:hypothetical protein
MDAGAREGVVYLGIMESNRLLQAASSLTAMNSHHQFTGLDAAAEKVG